MTALLLFVAQFAAYAVATYNIIAANRFRYVATGASAALLCMIQFVNVKILSSEASTTIEMFAFACGGVCGDVFGVWWSKRREAKPE